MSTRNSAVCLFCLYYCWFTQDRSQGSTGVTVVRGSRGAPEGSPGGPRKGPRKEAARERAMKAYVGAVCFLEKGKK
jgi:hypothetical protein